MITFSYKINSQPQTNDSYNTYLDIEPDENKLDIIKEFPFGRKDKYDGADFPGGLYYSDWKAAYN